MGKDMLEDFEKAVCEGMQPNKLFLKDYGEGVCANMWIMDAEYDPMRLSFGGDDDVTIHTGSHQWVTLTQDQLDFISAEMDEGCEMTRKHYEENPED